MLILSRLGGINFVFCTGCFSLFSNHLEKVSLFDGHLTGFFLFPLVIISDQVENAMDHQEGDHPQGVKAEPVGLTACRLH